MKKQLFVLTAALAAMVTVVRAEVATLKHGDELTVYYAADALKNALDDAVAGDVINLSSGFFNCSNINKAVTIIGAGMEADEDNGIAATNIVNGSGSTLISQPNEEASLKLEGLCFPKGINTPYSETEYGITMTRCRINYIRTNSPFQHAQFCNCVILGQSDYNEFRGTNVFVNCFIGRLNSTGTNSFVNCVLGFSSNANYFNNNGSAFMNCIIYEVYNNNSDRLQNVDYCIATTGKSYPISGASNYTNEQIFKTFRGTYTDGEMFELTDAGKQILGRDGTEVGMQGGYIPYDPTPTNIQIVRCTVDKQTDENGKLNVSIKLREKKIETEPTEPEEQTGE